MYMLGSNEFIFFFFLLFYHSFLETTTYILATVYITPTLYHVYSSLTVCAVYSLLQKSPS